MARGHSCTLSLEGCLTVLLETPFKLFWHACSLQLSLADKRGWCHPGDGNFHFKLEQFAFYKDHKYHNTDVYGARGNAFLVPLPVSPGPDFFWTHFLWLFLQSYPYRALRKGVLTKLKQGP